ncbi:CYTH and CHAD domain-containing protein [Acanthopleuribacter pedis]|uniref:CHAD domain-containing protein n=1 Tax=Acanthopleuribacter pedis TaxID=442870 RepID=A0A8J7U7F6_9BACT|nr:CYTH and CHAD domain-containing protein [Acanthopleuribacter pedis]MBO1322949.1 CHAD domain-containing protein [Acanthopleuribacter pedis]
MAKEIEIKFVIDPDQVDRIIEHPMVNRLALGPPKKKHVVSTYLDSPDLSLRNKGIGFRVRKTPDGWVQTVKAKGSGAGSLHQREEFECPIADDQPDYEKLAESQFAEIFADAALRDQLAPLFVTDFERTAWYLELEDFTTIEMVLDLGEIRAGDQTEAIHEVELELKGGNPVSLMKVAIALAESFPCMAESRSKAQRAYNLLKEPTWKPQRARPLQLNEKESCSQGFAAMIENCLAQVLANECPVLYGTDTEGVHQLRVGLRRMRSCLSLFRGLLPQRQFQFWRDEFKWLADEMGPARDWDVFCDESLAVIRSYFPEMPQLQVINEGAEQQRAAGYVKARGALRSQRYLLLVLRLRHWLDQRLWLNGCDAEQVAAWERPLMDLGIGMMNDAHDRFFKRGKKFDDLSLEQRHRLRILGKRARYTTEFFMGLYPNSKTVPYRKAQKGLQDQLGYLNDAVVADTLLDQLGLSPQDAGAGLIRGWFACNIEHLVNDFDDHWSRFKKTKPFWR